LDVENVRDRGVVTLQSLVGNFRRPAGLKDGFRRNGGDVGVDERSATHTGTSNHSHAFEAAQVSPAVKLLGVGVAPDPVVVKFARVSVFGPFLATLEHEDAFLFFRQTAGSNGSAETAADDYYVVVHRLPLPSEIIVRPEL